MFWFTAKLKKVKQLERLDTVHEKLETIPDPSPVSRLEEIKVVTENKRVLLAEDNVINQKVMLKMLSGLGFNAIDLANDGREAVTMSTSTSPPYDLILMDINMPLLDGVQATREIRTAGLNVPIIAMTANALKGQAEFYIAKGMTAYIAKPVDRKLLIKLLTSCLKSEAPG